MTDAIIVALIALLGNIIAVIASSKTTRDKCIQEIHTQQEIFNNEINHIKCTMTEMKADIKEHNHYGKLFSENIPVLKEKVEKLDKELDRLQYKS